MLNLTASSLWTLEVSEEINWGSRQDLHPGTGAHHFSFPCLRFIDFPSLPPTDSPLRLSGCTHPCYVETGGGISSCVWGCSGYSALLFCPQMDSSAHSYWKVSQRPWPAFQKETTKSLMFLPWASWRKHNSQLNHCAVEVGGGAADGT